jgi:hypothetical protein
MKLTQLQAAVLTQLSGEEFTEGGALPDRNDDLWDTLRDIVNHGAAGGVSGFIYTRGCCQFTLDNWSGIIAECRELWHGIGEPETLAQFIAGFNCLKGYSAAEIEEVLMDPKDEGDNHDVVLNALAWFALEETARAIVEGVDND